MWAPLVHTEKKRSLNEVAPNWYSLPPSLQLYKSNISESSLGLPSALDLSCQFHLLNTPWIRPLVSILGVDTLVQVACIPEKPTMPAYHHHILWLLLHSLHCSRRDLSVQGTSVFPLFLLKDQAPRDRTTPCGVSPSPLAVREHHQGLNRLTAD